MTAKTVRRVIRRQRRACPIKNTNVDNSFLPHPKLPPCCSSIALSISSHGPLVNRDVNVARFFRRKNWAGKEAQGEPAIRSVGVQLCGALPPRITSKYCAGLVP